MSNFGSVCVVSVDELSSHVGEGVRTFCVACGAAFDVTHAWCRNILLDGNGMARLCDFGLSVDIRPDKDPAKGSTGTKVRSCTL